MLQVKLLAKCQKLSQIFLSGSREKKFGNVRELLQIFALNPVITITSVEEQGGDVIVTTTLVEEQGGDVIVTTTSVEEQGGDVIVTTTSVEEQGGDVIVTTTSVEEQGVTL